MAAPVAALWLASPAVAWWLSRPLRPARLRLSAEDHVFLRTAARRTWRFFETFVGPVDNYLPPDNVQEDPPVAADAPPPPADAAAPAGASNDNG